MSEKVSIIVPIYNAEEFLHDCIVSIVTQTYTELEIILVNDGSTDKSGEICDFYARNDGRITVIQQINAGPSVARNRGIERATGTYIQFVDADDTIEATMTEILINKMARDTDLVICGYESGNRIFLPKITGKFDKDAFLAHFGSLYKDIIIPSPCNKMYRLERMKIGRLSFEETYALGEDLMFNLNYLGYCRFIYVLQENLYHYRKNRDSLTNAYIPNLYEKQKNLHDRVKDFLKANDCYTEENKVCTETIFANAIIHATTNLYHRQSPISNKEKKEQVHELIRNPDVMKQMQYFTDSLQARVFSYFVKGKAYRSVHFFFRFKEFLRFNLGGIFKVLQNINKR